MITSSISRLLIYAKAVRSVRRIARSQTLKSSYARSCPFPFVAGPATRIFSGGNATARWRDQRRRLWLGMERNSAGSIYVADTRGTAPRLTEKGEVIHRKEEKELAILKYSAFKDYAID